MAFHPFITSAANLIRIPSSNSSFVKIHPASTSITYAYPRPVTISYAPSVSSNSPREGTSSNIDVNTTGDMQFQETVGHHTDKPIKYLKTQFTAYQRYGLETTFSQSPYIPPSKRLSLSQELGTSEETIQNWFKNRRVRWRKEQRKTGASSAASLTVPSSTSPYFHYFGHMRYPNNKMMMRDARMLFGRASAHAQRPDAK
ncbi:subpallium neuron fate commitment [Desmophyllum pertusum]|uniref:Subpallium neuron fate commitment n=1 Tax=Desmophyllum pertusum TaxID=174260 RepID=A0A9X0A7P7_9CNID|nr:subpallium neuron fate commitment [Desmophyllum pertusum]